MSERAAPKAVVDTSVFISGVISPGGRPSRLLDLWHGHRFELLLSDQQYAELTDVLSRPRFVQHERITLQDLADLLTSLASATRVNPQPN